jgi:murein DD-endopeptidase MepM/ murein hydrolase activator NlpD
VVIDHDRLPDGSPGLWGLYAHLSKEVVSVGQRVEAGQKIGEVGTTGNSSGNHLHVGVYPEPRWSSGGGIDPDPWIDAEEDPFMGMTADDIGKAVAKHTWKDDIVPSPHGSDSDNPTWMAGSYLKEMYIRLRSIDERLERLEAERR